MNKTTRLSQLKNIGETSERLLNQVGIQTVEDLERVGVVKAWKRVKAIEPSANLAGLYALQGALMDIHWNALPDDIKLQLRDEWESQANG